MKAEPVAALEPQYPRGDSRGLEGLGPAPTWLCSSDPTLDGVQNGEPQRESDESVSLEGKYVLPPTYPLLASGKVGAGLAHSQLSLPEIPSLVLW